MWYLHLDVYVYICNCMPCTGRNTISLRAINEAFFKYDNIANVVTWGNVNYAYTASVISVRNIDGGGSAF